MALYYYYYFFEHLLGVRAHAVCGGEAGTIVLALGECIKPSWETWMQGQRDGQGEAITSHGGVTGKCTVTGQGQENIILC